MKKLFFFALIGSMVYFVSCREPVGSNGTVRQTISVDDFEKKLAGTANVQLIDVRTPEEYANGHLHNAVNINYNSDDFETLVGKLDKGKPVMVYCLSGGRSRKAADKLQELGFPEVYNMDGGIMKWGGTGKPLDKGAAAAVTSAGLTPAEFTKLTSGNKYVLVDYNAKWCEPCKKMLPVLETLAGSKKDKMSLLKIDADENKELLQQKGISGIPYLELYKDGILVWKHSGLIEADELVRETGL